MSQGRPRNAGAILGYARLDRDAWPTTIRYGGNTSCVEVRTDSGAIILIDCGTGAHALGQALEEQGNERDAVTSLSRTRTGITFRVCRSLRRSSSRANEWHIYGPRGLEPVAPRSARRADGVRLLPGGAERVRGEVHYHEVVEGGFSIGDVAHRHAVSQSPRAHGRLSARGGRRELWSMRPITSRTATARAKVTPKPAEGGDAAHVEFIRDADLVIHDAQYTAAEYPAKIGWGHSTIEYAVDMAVAANVQTARALSPRSRAQR